LKEIGKIDEHIYYIKIKNINLKYTVVG